MNKTNKKHSKGPGTLRVSMEMHYLMMFASWRVTAQNALAEIRSELCPHMRKVWAKHARQAGKKCREFYAEYVASKVVQASPQSRDRGMPASRRKGVAL